MTITKSILLGILISIFAFTNSKAQTTDEIVAKYVENTGGLENWENLKSKQMDYKSTNARGITYEVVLMEQAPNKEKIALERDGKIWLEAYDGTTAWTINHWEMIYEPTKLPEDRQKEYADNKVLGRVLSSYKEKGHSLTLEGKAKVENADCFKLKLSKKNGEIEYYFFDTQSYFLVMQETTLSLGKYKGKIQKAYYKDYRKVGGLVLPYAFIKDVEGKTINEIRVEAYKINPEFEDSEFAFKN